MPLILSVRVTQVRETIVSANSLEDAILIASAEFADTDIPTTSQRRMKDGDKPWGHVTEKVKQTHIHADLV